MAKLVGRNPKASKLADMNPALQLDPLSDYEPEIADEAAEESGDGAQQMSSDPMQVAVSKLTDIVANLTEDKKKKADLSRLDRALDTVSASSSDQTGLGYGKHSAVARRALRAMLHDQPEELYMNIEKLMWEDVRSQTLVPGMQSHAVSVRSWMAHHSRIGSHRALAHTAWAAAGALDALIATQPQVARARLAVLMMQFDQVAIDGGSWYLAAELGLEQGPPLTVLEQHKTPNVQAGESPYSRILDPRWAEISLTHLREQEEFLSRRKNLGKPNFKKDDAEDSESPK